MKDETLTSQRLRLRRFRRADAEAFAAYRSDPGVARYQSWEAPFPLISARRLTAAFALDDESAPGWFQWAIELPGERGIIGDIGVDRRHDGRQAAIGYTLATAHQRQGYASEAVTRMLDRLIVEEGLHRVSADCDTRNSASIKLLERLGFRREGHCVASTWSKGEWTDDYLYGMLADEWTARRARAR